jgi:hypothetical protein
VSLNQSLPRRWFGSGIAINPALNFKDMQPADLSDR